MWVDPKGTRLGYNAVVSTLSLNDCPWHRIQRTYVVDTNRHSGFSAYLLYALESETLMVAKNNKKH